MIIVHCSPTSPSPNMNKSQQFHTVFVSGPFLLYISVTARAQTTGVPDHRPPYPEIRGHFHELLFIFHVSVNSI